MGSNSSQLRNEHSISVVRHVKTKWIWLSAHDEALADAMYALFRDRRNYKTLIHGFLTPICEESRIENCPHDIIQLISRWCSSGWYLHGSIDAMQLIKQYCDHRQQCDYIIWRPVTLEEPRLTVDFVLSKQSVSTTLPSQPISIGLHISNQANWAEIVGCLSSASFPTLPERRATISAVSGLRSVSRTLYVDDRRADLNLITLPHHRVFGDYWSLTMMHVVVFNAPDSANWVNVHCRQIWMETQSMKNVVIWNRTGKHDKVLDEVTARWNVPCLRGHATDLLRFVVKYHWFRQSHDE
mmetsp:Transcript_9796/g.15705  ORF Transcript_9796/g.15705 Transcript_9796/m.15705 type:complete len:297 (+) Transcript_9796:28-918(+)